MAEYVGCHANGVPAPQLELDSSRCSSLVIADIAASDLDLVSAATSAAAAAEPMTAGTRATTMEVFMLYASMLYTILMDSIYYERRLAGIHITTGPKGKNV